MSIRRHLCAALLSLTWVPACAEIVEACADQAEMPPFVYAERVNGAKSEHITGASVELLRLIGQRNGWEVRVHLLPWARCMALVASQRMQFALNISEDDAKANGLAVSLPYFTMHNVYFYSRRARPQGLTLKHLDELRNYHVCGLGGYRFEAFGIRTESVDRGTTIGYEQLISKLHLGRCDLFIDSRETMAGQYLVNPRLRTLLVDGTLVNQPLPGRPTRPLYIGVASGDAHTDSLRKALDAGLEQMSKGHKLESLLEHYLQ